MNPEKTAQEYNDMLAEDYIQRARREGRSEEDGFDDYLEKELGIRRPEKTDEVLREIAEMERRSTEKFLNGLTAIVTEAAASAPAFLPIAFKFAGHYADALIQKVESSDNPKMKPAQKWLRTHKDDLLAELQY